ncbi:MAG: hypothetical protein KDK04_25165 [Candidatus Competibacteraceae bacterium]|nr:hypothetical protein [Candidatus Competibacteraceae bacterium]MCB1814980.1 hypothetical protein [Candidatus Competibacteraceae bacterium]
MRLPKRPRALMHNALAPLREQAYAAWVNHHRQPVATLITLAQHEGWVTEADIQDVLDCPQRHQQLYGLFCATLDEIPRWLALTARRHALDPVNMPDWSPWVQLSVLDGDDDHYLALDAGCCWLHSFDLDALPPALAVAIVHTLELIGLQLTECCLIRDPGDMWLGESVQAFEELQASGFLEMADLWHYAQEHTGLLDWHDWRTLDEFTAWWERTASYRDPQSVWLQRWLRQGYRLRDSHQLRQRLLKQVWRWRRCPALKNTAWLRWLKRALLVLSRSSRRWPEPPSRALALQDYDDFEPLAFAQLICFGEVWEADIVDSLYESAASAGTGFRCLLHCHLLAWKPLRDTLEALAIGQGLLIGAVQANSRERSHLTQPPALF